ncbi:MAG TPA: CotH kinase family protein, partial [Melioribacteraceae bacterium]|nr:CotH kinase family protein [Melioribacteraceae bacterium]
LVSDISFGRSLSNLDSMVFFSVPTPEKENSAYGFTGVTTEPLPSNEGGFYNSALSISIINASDIQKIYYTIDGAIPDSTSLLYSQPITISTTKVLRFIGYTQGKLKSNVVTNTYFINQNKTMPVISISTNPANLWDNETGIYVLGPNYDPSFPYMGANFWQDWERPAHFEIYEPDGITKYKSNAGIKIHGNWSRALAQKSLALFARGEYGNKEFEYKLFPNRPFTKYNNFILRNSGQDWESSMMRDLMMQNLVEDLDLDLQAGRPAVVYLNGVYWGIHNIREKLNEDMIASHHNLNPDEINILENNGEIVEGTNERYLNLISFINSNSLVNNTNYEFVKSQINMDNYVDYMLSQIYYANVDWPGNNIKYWTTQSDTSRWRYLIFDTDHGFGLYNQNAASHNTLTFALETNGPNWPNPPWSTLVLRKLVENQNFKNDFLNRYADLANSIFKKETVVAKIDSLRNIFNLEITNHIAKWNKFTYSGWQSNINFLRNFANSRLSYLTMYFMQKFGVTTTAIVNIDVNDSKSGTVKINRLDIKKYPFSGFYFKGVPVNVTALPKKGYKFVRWEGISDSDSQIITIVPNQLDSLMAIFEVDDSSGTIVINEINYNSNQSFNTEDWVEIYNTSSRSVDISGYRFKDEDDSHNFIFPQNTSISGNGYLVICIDTTLFKTKFPNVNNIIGNTGFGLSGSGELIRLYDKSLNIIDSLTYDDNNPWPVAPDGQGKTLSLINPYLDNSKPESWKASLSNGTPGTINDIYTNTEEENFSDYNYSLYQNYPNPFNPATTIEFSLAENSDIELSIFNILGQKISTIYSGYLDKGKHSYNFIAQNLASGIYFYSLNIKDKNKIFTKKLLLLK